MMLRAVEMIMVMGMVTGPLAWSLEAGQVELEMEALLTENDVHSSDDDNDDDCSAGLQPKV